MKTKKRLKQLAWREYLPLAASASMWAVILVGIGHADTARLLAARLERRKDPLADLFSFERLR